MSIGKSSKIIVKRGNEVIAERHGYRLSRRSVLHGLGAAIALPWLDAMGLANGLARGDVLGAAASSHPLRMAFLYVPNGVHMPDWTPTETGPNYSLTPILSQFGKHRDQINVLSGLTLRNAEALGDGPGDHARSVAAFLTGTHPRKTNGADILNGVSVDQLAATHIGHQTRLPSLELGTEASAPAGNCDSGYSCAYTSNLSWRTPTSPVGKEVDPALVFDRLFSRGEMARSPEQRAERNRRRQSILDFVLEDAQSLHRALGTRDQRKLDEYLYAVRDIERRMQRSEKLDQRDPSIDDHLRPDGVPRAYEDHVKLLLDMMVLAFQTDSTRVATFMFANAGSNRSYREIEVPEGHHDLSHHGNDPDKQQRISLINQFHARMFDYFLTKMSSIREADGTLLDSSMIVYGSGIGDGNRHNHDDLPIIMAGRGCGTIQTGRHIQFAPRTPLTNLYLTMLHRVGIDDKSFGDSTGPLDQLES